MLTFLGDFQANPTGANPYMVFTCFDELVKSKGIALMRGDLISNLDEDEGRALMTTLMNGYMLDSEYETIHQFNNEPDKFDYNSYITKALGEFNKLKEHQIKTKEDKIYLGEYKKHGHKTDKELDIFKGGIIR